MVEKMASYNKVCKMALELMYGNEEQKTETAKIENILEVSREVIFENSGDAKLSFATSCLIEYIYMTLAMRSMKNR